MRCLIRPIRTWTIVAMAIASVGAHGVPGADAVPPRPARLWHGMSIRPLDPAPLPPARSSSTGGESAPPPNYTPILPGSSPPDNQVLSNERTLTRWAYTTRLGPIRSRPRPDARTISRLGWFDADGFPEIYLLLRLHVDRAGRQWVKLRIPMRPNGRVGWVRREDLGDLHTTRDLLIVNRARRTMKFFTDGRLRRQAPVGIGKPSTPTPAGHFWIRERFKILDPHSGYWPYAFGTTDYSTLSDWPGEGVVGIHGPYFEPDAIPGDPSHGCIRLRVADDLWLGRHLSLGTPLWVR